MAARILLVLIPNAVEISTSSITSNRRSSRSYLATNDCGFSSRLASSAWVIWAFFLAPINAAINFLYLGVPKDPGIKGVVENLNDSSNNPNFGLSQFGITSLSGCPMRDPSDLRQLAPNSARITSYDKVHFPLYLRLLDAAEKNVDWRIVAADLMGLDVKSTAAKSCWQSHLRRARWMSETGYRQLLDSRK